MRSAAAGVNAQARAQPLDKPQQPSRAARAHQARQRHRGCRRIERELDDQLGLIELGEAE